MKISELYPVSGDQLDDNFSDSTLQIKPKYFNGTTKITNIGNTNLPAFDGYLGNSRSDRRYLYIFKDISMIKDICCLYSDRQKIRIYDKRIDYSFRGFTQSYSHLYQQEVMPPETIIKGRSLILSGQWSTEYYHFVNEILGKFFLFNHFFKVEEIDNIILRGSDIKFIKEISNLLWGETVKILDLDKVNTCQFEVLILPSMLTDPGFSSYQYVDFMNHTLLPKVLKTSKCLKTESVFINRRGNRKLGINEMSLQQICNQYKFHCLFLEDYSFVKQMEIMLGAKRIVAPHGGGLANTFAFNGSLTELVGTNYFNTCYLDLAMICENNYKYCALPDDSGDLHIDETALRECLKIQ